MEPTQETTIFQDGLGLLVGNFRDPLKPVIQGLVAVMLRRVQETEDVLWGVFESQMLATPPTGNALDQIGDLVGQPRGTFTDTEYLVFIKAIVRARRSGGRLEDTIALMVLIYGVGTFSYGEYFTNVAYDTTVLDILPEYANPTDLVLEYARPAGVYGLLNYSTWPTATDWLPSDAVSSTGGTNVPDAISGEFPFVPISCAAIP